MFITLWMFGSSFEYFFCLCYLNIPTTFFMMLLGSSKTIKNGWLMFITLCGFLSPTGLLEVTCRKYKKPY